jgi:hypothetical protein
MSSFTRGVTVRPGVIVLTVIPSAPDRTRQRACEADDAGLRRDVVNLLGNAVEHRSGPDVDDPTPASPLHQGKDRLGHEEDAGEVDVDDLLPVRGGDLFEGADREEPGAVDEHVDLTDLAPGKRGESIAVFFLRDVAGEREELAPVPFGGAEARERALLCVGRDDSLSVGEKAANDERAHPSGGSSDDDDSSGSHDGKPFSEAL